VGKGKIIVIEGPDKAGKRTQSRLLIDSLKTSGRVCVVMDFPDYTTPIGMEIRAFLNGKRDYTNEIKHMLLSANRWERKREIESMIDTGTIVVINRYYPSNIVYGVANGLNIHWLANLEKGLPKEDLVITLDVSPAVLNARSAEEDLDSFEKDRKLSLEVAKNYRKFAKQFKWKIVDGEKSKEQVHREILRIVKLQHVV
jgi:dTMP kinase